MSAIVGATSVRFVVCLAGAMMAATVAPPASAQALLKNIVMHEAPKPSPPITFEGARGQALSLADFKGKVVVLNLWATWCVSCRKEMPALDRLQAALGGPQFVVVPISIDRGGAETVAKYYAEIDIRDLAIYLDTSGQAIHALGAVGLPTTLIIDRDGREVARVVGPAEWDAPEVVEFLKPIIARQGDPKKWASRIAPPSQPAQSGSSGSLARAVQWLKSLFAEKGE